MKPTDILDPEAQARLSVLAAARSKLDKATANAQDRVRNENLDMEETRRAIGKHHGDLASHMASSRFREWDARLKRLTAEQEGHRHAVAVLQDTVLPQLRREGDAARAALRKALVETALAAKQKCESELAQHLAEVVTGRQTFLTAWQTLFNEFQCSWTAALYPEPRHVRLSPDPAYAIVTEMAARPVDRQLIPKDMLAALLAAEGVPDAPATIPPVPAEANVEAPEIPPTGELDPSIDLEAPPPEMATNTPLAAEPTPAPDGLDPTPADVDAEVEAELDAEALDAQDSAPDPQAISQGDVPARLLGHPSASDSDKIGRLGAIPPETQEAAQLEGQGAAAEDFSDKTP